MDLESRLILDSLPDGITVQDRNLRVIYQNRAMLAAFGNRVGHNCYHAYERRGSPCEGCGVLRTFQSGKPTLVLRTAFDKEGGTSYWENACFPIYDESGNIVAAAEVCRNITDRVGLESEVKERNIELGQLNAKLQSRTAELAEMFNKVEQEAEKRRLAEIELRHAQKLQAVGQLAAGIAHEINTPTQYVNDNFHFLANSFKSLKALITHYRHAIATVSSLPGHEELARELKETEATADLPFLEENIPCAFEAALGGISQISTIVSAMKEFAHSDQQEKNLADLNRALQVALTITKSEYKHVAEVGTDFGDIPLVKCRLSDLNQVFLNLLVNAAHAIADARTDKAQMGCIRVRTANEGDNVRIDISDTGCGIPDEIRDRVFEPFFTTKEVGRGTGQGLAIARSIIVDKHGGTMTFDTKVGEGTTFTIRLPVNGGRTTSNPPENAGSRFTGKPAG